ncbi:unnamed protein product [Penicillium camemberti]|uniref:Str. FM013 n=1 Tax=Penicillium camemberti (strain FM 013) TaxID=1429867 RepID=A0A0G4NXI9_PENC3|nr:unnamed protein product [Penicillium camemberti]
MGKINLFLVGLLGLEFLLPISFRQWSSARASVKIPRGRIRELDYNSCILR